MRACVRVHGGKERDGVLAARGKGRGTASWAIGLASQPKAAAREGQQQVSRPPVAFVAGRREEDLEHSFQRGDRANLRAGLRGPLAAACGSIQPRIGRRLAAP